MERSIDKHIEILKTYYNGFSGWVGDLQDSIDVAVDIMSKYQKIEQAYSAYLETMNPDTLADLISTII